MGNVAGSGNPASNAQRIFRSAGNSNAPPRGTRFTLSDIVVRISADVAWVTGTENILTQSQGNISVTAVLVTNVFERRGTRWRMVLHHASHILTGEVESSA